MILTPPPPSLPQGVNQDKLGIYIKSVVPGGAADQVSVWQRLWWQEGADGSSLIKGWVDCIAKRP